MPRTPDADAVLARFSPATREWFRASFSAPTAAQAGAWDAISRGEHAVVVAPTGSGKTLSAFLWAIDRLVSEPRPEEKLRRCRVVYISPMKALGVDVERNLRSPLVGIGHAATRLGLELPDVTVAVRSGDTPASERRRFATAPSDILITTPESLFLLLTSAAREALRGVETVIVDEIHAVAGTKRGAHLALSLERLDALLDRPAQRVGLSATARPVEEVGRFLTGGRPVAVVQPPSVKEWELDVVVPVEDLAALDEAPSPDGPDAGARAAGSIWPHVEERIVDLVAAHTSTLVFTNSRRTAERLTARLNEIWEERLAGGEAPDRLGAQRFFPADYTGSAGVADGAPPVLAMAHHGSMSKERRGQIEEDLKAGRLPAVVATSSLELGIDMGAIDLVIQVEAPPSVASGLQRVGRAGHQVGAVSHGVFLPKYRGDLLTTAVVTQRMREGAIESLRIPTNPLDVLAQQVVAACALEDQEVDALFALVTRAAPFAGLTRGVFESVLDMLSGRYPADELADLRPHLVWDRRAGVLHARPGAQLLANTSGGTIPDRGLYPVYLASGTGPGRRVGELDEEMVHESRGGDVITLGTSAWEIQEITHDRVLVLPAPGRPGRLPFWKGDSPARPAELGAAVAGLVRAIGSAKDAEGFLTERGLDAFAAANLARYVAEQQESTRHLPDGRTIVVERFRDEIGDWRVAIHNPLGGQVNAPWSLVLSARLAALGYDVQAQSSDDGIVLHLPDLGDPGRVDELVLEALTIDPAEVVDAVTEQVGGSALFAARFREAAARALLLPRRRPGQRQALWQQRQRAAQLLAIASRYPTFPIVLEAVRECLQDVFDVPALEELMRALARRDVRLVAVETPRPSPFAQSLLFGYVGQFLYEGDAPLAERRAAALQLDPVLLAELLGRGEGASMRDLISVTALDRTVAELQHTAPDRRADSAERLADLVRRIGPVRVDELPDRVADGADAAAWVDTLVAAHRLLPVTIAGVAFVAAAEDAGRLRDALGVAMPPGVPFAFLEPVAEPLEDLLARYARCHGPFTTAEVAERFGLAPRVVADVAARLVDRERLVAGELLPASRVDGAAPVPHSPGPELCDPDVLRLLRRRSLAELREQIEPADQRDLARFLPAWQGVGAERGVDGLRSAIDRLAGARVCASALESLVLPGRVRDYSPAMLDELLSSGEVLWQGHGALPGDDGWVSLHFADDAEATLAAPEPVDAETFADLLDVLSGGGAFGFRALSDRLGRTDDLHLVEDLWELVWAGRATADTFAPVRALLSGGRTAHKPRAATAGRTSRIGRRAGLLRGRERVSMPSRTGPPLGAGRWSGLPEPGGNRTERALITAELLLARYGIVTRGAVLADGVPGGFAGVYETLVAAEHAGTVQRGYFVEGLGGAQFATGGAVDRLRATGQEDTDPYAAFEAARTGRTETRDVLVLAATDPANPFGAALDWPEPSARDDSTRHRPARRAGAIVALDDGALVAYIERGGRTVLTFTDDEAALAGLAHGLGRLVERGTVDRISVETIDGSPALTSDHPLVPALREAGFHETTRGLRRRR